MARLTDFHRQQEISRLGSVDPLVKRDQVRVAWWQKNQHEVVDKIRCRVVAQDWSMHTGFAVVHH
jgi:hypothetical protein